MSGFPMGFGGNNADGASGQQNQDGGASHSSNPNNNSASSNFDEMNSMMFNATAGMGMGNPMGFGGMGGMSGMPGGMSGMDMSMTGSGAFVPELDMMALYRAKQNMMGRGRPASGGAGASVQEKMMAFTQEQYAKGQGLPMGGMSGSGRGGGMDGMAFPPSFMHSGAASADIGGTAAAGQKRGADETADHAETSSSKKKKGEKGAKKRRKKSKKNSDMPRRALSAYNIFFSEQRGIILKEIGVKEGGDGGDEKPEENSSKEKAKQKDVKEESTEEGEETLKVLNRSFFPKRAKRAHRKVHGKIGLVDLARAVSKRWKELTPEKKKVYEDLAAEDRKRHKEVMAEYQERKAAENMLSMGSDEADEKEDGAATDGDKATADSKGTKGMGSEQDVRDTMAQEYQQRILAEMMASRRPQQDQMSGMMNMNMMSRGGGMAMSGMSDMQAMQDMNDMLAFQNQQTQRALMLQRMRMGGGMGGNFGMGMDGMGPM
ncbi:MAG: hypothetical protein SGILL_006774 [Bacillariaceae sp.]